MFSPAVLLTASTDSLFNSAAPVTWWLVGGGFVIASTLGFLCGFVIARGSEAASGRRLRSNLAALFERLNSSLKTADETCSLLSQIGQQVLTVEQSERLKERQSGLMNRLSRLIDGVSPAQPTQRLMAEMSIATAEIAGKSKSRAARPTPIKWQLEPADPVTLVPARTAFQANLQTLLDANRRSEQISAALLVQIDKYSSLQDRLGNARLERLTRRFVSLVCRSVREVDCVARWTTDTWGILLPYVEPQQAAELAAQLRDQIRNHRFRVEESGPEVYVTASLGMSLITPAETADIVMSQAHDALSQAQRRGRNQLQIQGGPRPGRMLASL